nr:hypothetical protein [uncultured Pseudodesulfovibrio sp.]
MIGSHTGSQYYTLVDSRQHIGSISHQTPESEIQRIRPLRLVGVFSLVIIEM